MFPFDDEEPPMFAGMGEHNTALRSNRCKNPSRIVSDGFSQALLLARHNPTGVLGHYCEESSEFWPDMGNVLTAVLPSDVTVLGANPDALTIPASSRVPGTGTEFLDFAVPAGSPPWLFVALQQPLGPQALADQLGSMDMDVGPGGVVVVQYVTKPDDEYGPTMAFDETFIGGPCPHAVYLVNLGPVYKARSCEVAHRLVCCNMPVSVAVPMRGPRAAPKIRIQAGLLRWVKDADLVPSLSKFADSVPGMVHGSASPCKDSLSWSGIVYDHDFGVARAMLSWGALAAWVSKDWLNEHTQVRPAPSLSGVCEPLGSYLRALQTMQQYRNGDPSAQPALEYNSPQKMTAEQSEHAVQLFYWASIHRDDGTRPMTMDALRISLEMYLRFGYVILRKRAYQFHGKTTAACKRLKRQLSEVSTSAYVS